MPAQAPDGEPHPTTAPLPPQIPRDSIKSISWYDFGRYCQLWVAVKGAGGGGGGGGASSSASSSQAPAAAGELHRFDGLRSADYARINDHCKGAYSLNVPKRTLATKGQTWGTVRLSESSDLEFHAAGGGGLVAPLPLSAIASAALPGKGDLEIQIAYDDVGEKEDECLVEVRLYVPPGAALPGITAGGRKRKAKGGGEEDEEEEGGGGGGGGGEEAEEGEAGADAVGALHKALVQAAGIHASAGEALVMVPNGQFQIPHGRFSIEFFPHFFRLHGTSYEFKVSYKAVLSLHYLPIPTGMATSHEEATKYALIISLSEPLRQGNFRHAHLVLQVDNVEATLPLRIPAEAVARGDYGGLGKDGVTEISGALPKLVAGIFRRLTDKAVSKPERFATVPTGAGGGGRQRALRCHYKNTAGLLFPLNKSMLFTTKPTFFIQYADVEAVEVVEGESVTGSKSFGLSVRVRAVGGEKATVHVFSLIDKREQQNLLDYFDKDTNIKVIKPRAARAPAGFVDAEGLDKALKEEDADGSDEDDEDDESFNEEGSEEEDGSEEDSSEGGGGGGGGEEEDDEGAFKRKRGGEGKKKKKGGKEKKGKKEKSSKKQRK